MPIFMFILVLALPVTAFTVHELDKPDAPKLCQHYNIHEARMIEGPCK